MILNIPHRNGISLQANSKLVCWFFWTPLMHYTAPHSFYHYGIKGKFNPWKLPSTKQYGHWYRSLQHQTPVDHQSRRKSKKNQKFVSTHFWHIYGFRGEKVPHNKWIPPSPPKPPMKYDGHPESSKNSFLSQDSL